jgi:hypothetical protein
MHAFVALLLSAQPALPTVIYSPDPAKWYVVPSAKYSHKELFNKAHDSDKQWFIFPDAKNGRVIATPHRELIPQPRPDFSLAAKETDVHLGWYRCVTKVDDGWLVGYNSGEFGGAVCWFSEDGKKRDEVYRVCNPNQFIHTKEGLFVVEGLAHLGSNFGSVVRLSKSDGKWTGKLFARLPAEGCAVTDPGDGTLLVAIRPKLTRTETSPVLVRVTKDGEVGKLLEVADSFPEPTSVAIAPSGIIYIGTQQFVIAFDPKAKQPGYKLLIPRAGFLKQ